MKRLLPILLTLALLLPVRAQNSVSLLATNCENITMTSTSAGLIGLGLLAAYQPDVNSWAVALRDEVMFYDPPKLEFDNYLQYLPAVTPAVLNLCGVEGRHDFKKLLIYIIF